MTARTPTIDDRVAPIVIRLNDSLAELRALFCDAGNLNNEGSEKLLNLRDTLYAAHDAAVLLRTEHGQVLAPHGDDT